MRATDEGVRGSPAPMYESCPKCGHKQDPHVEGSEDKCQACGIVFSKWLRSQLKPLPAVDTAPDAGQRFGRGASGAWGWFVSKLFYTEPDLDAITVYGRAVVLVVAIGWGMKFILADATAISGGVPEVDDFILHRVNLVFHEAGHVIFSVFGNFMGTLGGSLGQLVMPLVVMCAFLFKYNNPFGASIGLWWLGQSAIDLVPYIADARSKQLILLGGITGRDSPLFHDWANILGYKGWLRYDQEIAMAVDLAGETLMIVAMVWGAVLVWRQWGEIKR